MKICNLVITKNHIGAIIEVLIEPSIIAFKKQTLMRYLGQLIIAIIFLQSCGRNECGSDVEFVFINNSDYSVEIVPLDLILESNTSTIVPHNVEGPCGRLDGVCPLFQDGTIKFNNGEKCWVLDAGLSACQGDGPVGSDNYTFERINDRSYKMTYTFVNDQYDQANLCE